MAVTVYVAIYLRTSMYIYVYGYGYSSVFLILRDAWLVYAKCIRMLKPNEVTVVATFLLIHTNINIFKDLQ